MNRDDRTPIIAQEDVLNLQLCCPKDITPQQAEVWLSANHAAGTSAGWVYRVDLGSVVCADDPGRVHYVFGC